MQNFDTEFTDFPDYILKITHNIWEQKRVETLNDYYTKDIIVRSPSSQVFGNQKVITATHATLAEFPDRQLLGEDVIWSGCPETGMLSSHRILSTATHLGDGVYGKASGKKLVYRVMADCHAINNQINDEWLIRDQGAIISQMGWDIKTYARQQITDEGGPEQCTKPFTPSMNKPGPYLGRGNDNEWGQCYADYLGRIMAGDLPLPPKAYDRACSYFLPNHKTVYGRDHADRFWQELRASVPDAKFSIDHQIGRVDPMLSPRAAIRWSLTGKHEGAGRFGPPTGTDLYIMGISHCEFGPFGIRREYTVFDDVAIWKQIHLKSGNS